MDILDSLKIHLIKVWESQEDQKADEILYLKEQIKELLDGYTNTQKQEQEEANRRGTTVKGKSQQATLAKKILMGKK